LVGGGPITTIDGSILIGASSITREGRFEAVSALTGEVIGRFSETLLEDVGQACALADAAFDSFNESAPEVRATFLETIAEHIALIGNLLIDTASEETGLPRGRLEGERARTLGQLRMFAELVRGGEWIDATIDSALPDRAPLPRPDLRRRQVGLGPVAVFGASNFPLAFSVAGGDTASAFAAGCPVVFKGHPAHPGTSELVGRAIGKAVAECGLHEGIFSLLPGVSHAMGGALVADPRVQAVGFTGSRAGGLALCAIGAKRDVPIPVYAEMSSINPVILFPAALEARGVALGIEFVQSLTAGVGQFCTNPGLVIALDGPPLAAFIESAATALSENRPAAMLTAAIHANYARGIASLELHGGVRILGRGCAGDGVNQAPSALFATDAASFLSDRTLREEVFGASSVVVCCADMDQLARVIAALEGQLTITFQMSADDEPLARRILPMAARKAGRILANGWPTGVEVSRAMVHGGPFPATSDVRSTSVGTLAIERFLRPVCYQNFPDAMLPLALRAGNPWRLSRNIDGASELAPDRKE
jgi:alpha-ketoglutaric semialdehyde dehydrogenase